LGECVSSGFRAVSSGEWGAIERHGEKLN
jgi:hypothetical protein